MPASHHNHPEAAEREPVATPFNGYPKTALDLIQKIGAAQDALRDEKALGKSWSNTEFVSGSKVPANTWFALRAGSYPWPKTTSKSTALVERLEQLATHAKTWQRSVANEALRASASSGLEGFIEFPEYIELKAAIKACQKKVSQHSEERLVMVVGETRSGKTTMKRKLLEDGIATWAVHATPSWKGSYFEMLTALYKSIFQSAPPFRKSAEIEREVLNSLRQQTGCLVIEELRLLSPQGTAFLRTLLNETTCTLVIMMAPEDHLRLRSSTGADRADRAQLMARVEWTVRIASPSPEVVKAFAPDLWPHVRPDDERLQLIATAASALGSKSCIARATACLKAVREKFHRFPTLADAQAALADYRDAVSLLNVTRLDLKRA